MNKKNNFLVRVQCATYNHVHYITDALDGFCMQQTNFPFVCTIVDDASTDGEQEVIKKYLTDNFDLQDISVAYEKDTDYGHVTYAQHKTNKNCYFAVVLLKENHYSQSKSKQPYLAEWMDTKYVAICEGDDYWTDSLKLQKQVDYLEGHEECSMCFHAAKISLEGVDPGLIGAKCENIDDREYSAKEVFDKWIVPTASIVYRKNVVSNYKLKHPEWLTRGDISLVLKCAHVGRIYGKKDVMSVYRMQPNSVSHNIKYRGKEVFGLPNHFRCIYINYPKVDKALAVWNISHAYYVRMKAEKSLLGKLRDFFLFIYWDPKYAIQKIVTIAKRKFD